MREDGKIDYVEFPSTSVPAVKTFYAAAFGWTFVDYGPDYAAFDGAGLDGGFNGDDAAEGAAKPLVVLYAHDLEAMAARVTAAGGVVVKPIYSFPGGRRFHFTDPSGNELAVWSEG
ncbi:MAG: VOC family protein [Caulobacter sp.]|nr:VOC family protein [Caulobacter sp.]